MSSKNVLDPIWRSYKTTIDCLKIAERVLENENISLKEKTKFAEWEKEEAEDRIYESRTFADDHVIVSLWAVFERKLLDYLQKEGNRLLLGAATNFSLQVHRKIESEMEYWKSDDILNIFKTVVDPDLIGNAKQVKKYRDWIAHKNPNKNAPSNISPLGAYEILKKIIMDLESAM
ncbi:MAG: hypothetical protein AB1656_11000 [Candidatus Omnitrophota bacterium]